MFQQTELPIVLHLVLVSSSFGIRLVVLHAHMDQMLLDLLGFILALRILFQSAITLALRLRSYIGTELAESVVLLLLQALFFIVEPSAIIPVGVANFYIGTVVV